MTKKFKQPTDGPAIANLGQINRALQSFSDTNVEELQSCMDDIGPFLLEFGKNHREAMIVTCLMALLDGYEKENRDNLREMLKGWHARAALGKRSWEAS